MRRWVEDHLKAHKRDYWFRIPDSSEGTKPFDGILMCSDPYNGKRCLPIAIEFKVWRKKADFDFSTVESHQLRELLLWEKAGGEAWILVLMERTGKELVFYPRRKVLEKLLRERSK